MQCIKSQIGNQVVPKLNNQVSYQVWDQSETQIRRQVREQVSDPVLALIFFHVYVSK